MQRANLFAAQLRGANIGGTDMRGATLFGAQMHDAILYGAQMQGADMRGAQLQGASLITAQLQGANLAEVQMDASTDLTSADFKGAALRAVDVGTAEKVAPLAYSFFADATVQIRDEAKPDHWSSEKLLPWVFEDNWRAWQRSIGMDPENPE